MAAASCAFSYSLTVQSDSPSYSGNSNITITGQVSPAPGPNTAVLVRVFNPNSVIATAAEVAVNGTTGLYSVSFVAGGSSAWVDGRYTVNATWGAYGTVIFKTAAFSWTSSPVTTTTSTTSTSAASTTTSVTSSTTPTSSVITTSGVQTSSSHSTSSSSSSTSSTGTPTTSAASVPEFPYQVAVVAVFTALMAGSYLLIRSRRGRAPTSGLPR